MAGYTKLHSGILDGSIWNESVWTRVVWIAFLAKADQVGRILAVPVNMARIANVPMSRFLKAVETLSSPDPDSRTPDEDGRRIIPIQGGWQIVNYEKYRTIRDEDERKVYKRQWDREHRPSGHARTKTALSSEKQQSEQSDSSPNSPSQAEAEAEAYKYTTIFDTARKKYPGTKRGNETEFNNFQKKHADWEQALPLLLPAVEMQAAQWRSDATLKKYIPHFQTWINQRRWEQADGPDDTDRKQAVARALEAKREEMRREYGSYYQSKPPDELVNMRKEKNLTTHWWLIDEISAAQKQQPKTRKAGESPPV